MVPDSKSMSHEAHLFEKNLLLKREVFCDSPIRTVCTLLGHDLNFLRWSTILLSGINEDQAFPVVFSRKSARVFPVLRYASLLIGFTSASSCLEPRQSTAKFLKISSNLLIIDTHE